MINHKDVEGRPQLNDLVFKNFLDLAPIGLFYGNHQGDCLYANEKFLRMCKIDLEEVVSWMQAIHSDDYERVLSTWKRNFEHGSHFELEFRLCQSNHWPIWVSVKATMIKNSLNELIGFVASMSDIGKYKLAESELDESIQRFSNAFKYAAIGMALVSLKGEWIKVNDSVCKLLGRTEEELMQMTFQNITHPDDLEADLEYVHQMLEGTIPTYEMQKRYFHKSGRCIWARLSVSLVRDQQQNPLYFISQIEDITEEKEALEKLQQINIELNIAREEAEASNRIKSNFLDIAAHELRTPVTAFTLLLQNAQRKIKKNTSIDQDILKRLKVQADRISRLVIDLLDVSRLERGVLNLKIESTDIVKLISECLEDFKLRTKGRHIHFSYPKNPVIINIDPVRIYQVFSNLLDNILKYTPEDTSVEISIISTSKKIKVYVTDYGTGISPSQQVNLFNLFSRGAHQLTERYSGLGLGLFISRAIIQLHGGKMNVSSDPGHGSTFYFELPQGEA